MNIYTISFIVILIFNLVKNKKSLHMLQQNLYNENNRYIKWITKNLKTVFLSLDLISLILIILAYISTDKIVTYILIILALISYLAEALRIISIRKTEQVKKPLVITKRIRRLIVTISLLFVLPIIAYIYNYENSSLILLIMSAMTYFSYFVVYIGKVLNTPIEKMVYNYYDKKAKKKLKSMSNLKVIGITGSYGKTSSKNILNDILNVKYISRATPKNLNTEYGLMITINNHIDKFDEIFIAEMGAYKRGEIRKLCNMVHPKYAILTRIGLAHLETFGSPEKIIKTKFELVESLPEDGVAVLNGDDPKQVSYKIENNCKKIWIGIENQDVDIYAENIECDYKGSKFDVVFKGDDTRYRFETKLLGTHNIYNILAGIALGKEFGMSIVELQKGVQKVKPIESRLELRNYGYMYQINDAYNSNPLGAKMALDVLDMMPGLKVVVTPGMTELGDKEDELNNIFGSQMSRVADYIILVGANRTKPILSGIIGNGFDSEKVYVVNSVYEAYTLLQGLNTKEDIYALFENDLPDLYNE
ncbi:MAG: UDP-N-acetylmuramoyl-tripeptide--D-alanyl-D-alanine ligase [Firmicutes bacterium]|nr:UDP-N-acetylmuramoyl-tripeptide--D-alanyl-D-alanine ligase [Bacillota bacterium]